MLEDIKKKLKGTPVHSVYQLYKTKISKEAGPTKGFPKNRTWAFNAGNTFSGNPKYLFLYINKYRKDIDAYWLCDNEATVQYIRRLGYNAFQFSDKEAHSLEVRTGVYVVEQVKESIPERMGKVKLLNLYHGVGCKSIERRVNTGFLNEKIIKKYIRYNQFYYDRQLFLVTSPLMEKHFIYQCGLKKEQVIRGGYPRCMYQKYFEKANTFDHDIRKRKGLGPDTKIAAYVPTYRDNAPLGFMSLAIPDIERLIQKLEENNMLMIFKMHPLIEGDFEYVQLKEKYKDHPRLLFWDNQEDFYEIFDEIEVGIIDYSSIFYDMLAGGTKYFIRYFFDYDDGQSFRDMVYDLEEMTCGRMCKDFNGLLDALDSYQTDDTKERERIQELFWKYESKDSMEQMIEAALAFTPEPKELPSLYTFDIFDTLISRKVLEPEGVFYKVRERMEGSSLQFPPFFQKYYPQKRKEAEQNVRERYHKTLELRDDGRREITFEEIFDRMAEIHGLSQEQKQALMAWELEAEWEDSIPIPDAISYVKDLVARGETVCLVSDMYLGKDFIKKLLCKSDPALAELPLFLSREYGVQKTTKKLYMEVYNSFDTYSFGKWIHHGDSSFADGSCARALGITTELRERAEFNEYEWSMAKEIGTYDGFRVAAMLARFRKANGNKRDYYAYGHISMYFVPYIQWALQDAVQRGIQCLYFISRDGYQLKRIADTLIEQKGLPLKTKYIYGSRRAWRIPSLITEIDKEYFSSFGNFVGVSSYEKLLGALNMEEEEFLKIFPDLEYLRETEGITKEMRQSLIVTFSNSAPYREFILDKAARDREIVLEYLRQEIDFEEAFAFVEYWGRGYTQDCAARLLEAACGRKCDVPFYYMRSIYKTEGNVIRYNYTTAMNSLIYAEAIFATIPYKSVERYLYAEDGRIVPELIPLECDMELFHAMERCLVQFTEDFYSKEWDDEAALGRALQRFSVEYFEGNQDDPVYTECLATLVDSVGMYGDKREYAPAFTEEMVDGLMRETPVSNYTKSLRMSLARTDKHLADKVAYIKECVPELRKEGSRKMPKLKEWKEDNALASYWLSQYKAKKERFQKAYSKYAKLPVEAGKAILFTNESLTDQAEYWSLERALKKRGIQHVLRFPRKSAYDEGLLKELATAEYVFTNRHFELMRLIGFRKETFVVQMGEFAFYLNSFGMGASIPPYLKDLRRWTAVEMESHYSLVPAASDAMKDVLEASYWFRHKEGQVKAIGACCTDIYFSETYCTGARRRLEALFPQAKGKQVIVYLPSYRHRMKGCRVLEFLDIRRLKEALSDEYALAVDFRVPQGKDSYLAASGLKDFFYDFTGEMSIRELIAAGDVFVGDYRNTFFESFLRRKPVFLTADDCVEFAENKEHNFNYAEIMTAPVVSDADSLIYQLGRLEQYDYSKLEQFCEAYLGACDGKAAERVLDAW